MTTYIVDIARVGKHLYADTLMFCHAVGQADHAPVVYKEIVAQILAIINTDPTSFNADTYMLPQWASLIYVEETEHTAALKQTLARQVRLAAMVFYDIIMLSGIVPQHPPESLYRVESVDMVKLQFSVIINSLYL